MKKTTKKSVKTRVKKLPVVQDNPIGTAPIPEDIKTEEVVVTKDYKATILILGKKFHSTGASISEVISNLKPGNCKGKSILSLERNGRKVDRILMPVATYRLFNSVGLTKEISLKQISSLFQGL